MIQHSVIFSLRHPKGSPAEAAFLADAMVLAEIPGVIGFTRFRQTSRKNEFDYGFVMRFEDDAAYQAYNSHPDHVAFVHGRWNTEVEKFLEIDFAPLGAAG